MDEIKKAREHVERGEAILKEDVGESPHYAAIRAAVATAHFSAAMAITNILLTDPAEAPEPAER